MDCVERRIAEPWIVAGMGACGGLIAATGAWATLAQVPGVGVFETCCVVVLLLVTLVSAIAVARGSVATRVAIAAASMTVPAGVRLSELAGHEWPYIAWDHGPVANVAAVGGLLAAIGLLRRWTPARWLAAAAATVSMGGAALNSVPTLAHPDMITWSHLTTVGVSGLLALLLAGASMREAFGGGSTGALWSSREPVIRALRWTFGTNVAAIPMLLVYAWTQPVVVETADAAVVLAGVLTLAAGLCALRSLLGAIMLAVGGACLLALTVVTAWMAHDLGPVDPWIVSYYAVFWVPAGVISLATAGVMARPLLAALRRS